MRLKDNTNPFIHVNPPYQLMVIHSSKLVYPRELYQRGVCLLYTSHPSSALRRLTHRLRWLTVSRPSIPTHPSNRPLRTLGALRT